MLEVNFASEFSILFHFFCWPGFRFESFIPIIYSFESFFPKTLANNHFEGGFKFFQHEHYFFSGQKIYFFIYSWRRTDSCCLQKLFISTEGEEHSSATTTIAFLPKLLPARLSIPSSEDGLRSKLKSERSTYQCQFTIEWLVVEELVEVAPRNTAAPCAYIAWD